jgi:hypothetical protein
MGRFTAGNVDARAKAQGVKQLITPPLQGFDLIGKDKDHGAANNKHTDKKAKGQPVEDFHVGIGHVRPGVDASQDRDYKHKKLANGQAIKAVWGV